ncbi:hypothetical protein Emtol_3408 [Emticicia oligotrophica DSM 17448]|uniref:HEPN AbiU2-like domain-containing protein n=1 Tax=Emticicia oligotrophica (strain DSM 17448 / CIP 109782 / MTCC 6937 / GPTSA100-15) TaxID=929562 RepID=A0ABM5N525_EMTOG|nr:hypothetical protein [Emticicia oligotrophica]AFK04537.1 hypothetical protein Emtol_3408 [Emticicia oligotrophica DSM 17448]
MKVIEKDRLLLWSSALRQARRYIFLSQQIELMLSNKNEEIQKKNLLNQPYKNSGIYTPVLHITSQETFLRGEELYKNDRKSKLENLQFGDTQDLIEIKNCLKIQSIVLYCKILNRGDSKKNKEGENIKIKDKYLNEIEQISIPSEYIDKYETLKINLLNVRNSVLAHDDLEFYEITRNETSTKFWSNSKFLIDIDFAFFDDCMRWIEKGISFVENNSN